MFFPTCQTQCPVLLYTINGFALTTVSDQERRIVQYPNSIRPDLGCPLVFLCDAPTFTAMCATGLQSFINPTFSIHDCGADCASIGVEPVTWSYVKSLYFR